MAGLTTEQLVTDAVRRVEAIFMRNARFLRAVLLISGVRPEILRRGALDAQELGDRFAGGCQLFGVTELC